MFGAVVFSLNHIVKCPFLENLLANRAYQGNLLKGIDKKTDRREGIKPIKRNFTYRKVTSSRLSRLVAHLRIFRLYEGEI